MAWIHISYGNFTVGLFSDDGDCHKVISGEGLRSRDPRTGDFDEGLDGAGEAPAKGGCGGGSAGSRDLSSMVQQYKSNDDDSNAESNVGLFLVCSPRR